MGEGPYTGWLTWVGDPYEAMLGPFYFHTADDGSPHGSFVPEARHANGGGIVHGGALMSFADTTLGALLYMTLSSQFAVTVTLNSEFVGAGVVGSPIHSSGRIVRDTKSLVFVHGQLEQDDKPILMFSSVMKKITPRSGLLARVTLPCNLSAIVGTVQRTTAREGAGTTLNMPTDSGRPRSTRRATRSGQQLRAGHAHEARVGVGHTCHVALARFSESITLRVPPTYAFDFLADPSTAPIIDPAVIEYRPDELPMRQGVRVKIRMRAWGVATRIESVVAEWVPGRAMVMQGVRPSRPMTVSATHSFDSSVEGCTYTWAMTFEPNAPLGRFVTAPSCRFMRRNAQRQQRRFKTHVEARWQAESNRV